MRKISALLLAFTIVCSSVAYPATSALRGEISAESGPQLPAYNFKCTDPLYATIAAVLRVKNVHVRGEKSIDLKVPGCSSDVPVQAVIQNHRAPLVVVLLGIGAKAKADYSKVWPSWFSDAGYHVLFFDSTVGSSFQKVSHHGVSGNVWAETERVRDIISAFLKLEAVNGRVSQIGVVGYSYGGIEALVLGQMAAEGKVPFEISAIQAFGPPIDLLHSAEILDTWYREDRWEYKLSELKEMFTNLPSYDVRPAKISERAMRAAISAVFRIELADVIVANDTIYKLGKLPKGDQFDEQYVKEEYAETHGFIDFAYDFALPYWETILGRSAVDRLTGETNMCKLFLHQPSYSEVIMVADDPFNLPQDFAAFKAATAGRRVTILPHGGHIGFLSDPWTRAKLMTLFGSRGSVAANFEN